MILLGNCLDVLKTLPSDSVHAVVTSPPYWSLRDYGVPPTIWGGDPACAHAWDDETKAEGFSGKRKWQHSENGRGDKDDAIANASKPSGSSRRGLTLITRKAEPGVWSHVSQGQFCTRCGAWRGCLGLEPTIELYVAHLVEIFEEVRRVLRKDGTCWLNLGDSYADSGRGGNPGRVGSGLQGSTQHQEESKKAMRRVAGGRGASGLKAKDLCMIPARVALALHAAGWYLRSDIVWSKPNPMPESTRDRPTKSHEFVFLLAKSPKYFYDADAIREPVTGNAHHRGRGVHPKSVVRVDSKNRIKANQSFSAAVRGLVGSRNRRSVWTLSTKPFKGAHFATFPPRLVEPCILAGTSAYGCCPTCGAGFARVVQLGAPLADQMAIAGANTDGRYHGKAQKAYAGAGAQDPSATKARILKGMRERITVGWKPTCRCGGFRVRTAHSRRLERAWYRQRWQARIDARWGGLHGLRRAVVLDPFGGSGTTALVAERLGREYLLIELGAQNVAMAEERVAPALAAARTEASA